MPTAHLSLSYFHSVREQWIINDIKVAHLRLRISEITVKFQCDAALTLAMD